MSGSKKFVLDANVFIEAKNKYYRFSLCPGYWTALIAHHSKSRVCSIDKVRDELASEGDQLSEWANGQVPTSFFKITQDQTVVKDFQELVAWVNSATRFTPAAKTEFAAVADGWVVAYAKANGLTVVTHEEYAPEVKRKVPMPNVCLEFDVDYINVFEMLEDLNVKFILSTKRRRKK